MVARAAHDVMRYRRVLATVPAVCVPSTPSIPALSRSRSFAVIHSPSLHSTMRYQSGTFYFAERGTSHVAATSNPFTLDNGRKRAETCGPIQDVQSGNSRLSIVGR
jgi:hypothetical protein